MRPARLPDRLLRAALLGAAVLLPACRSGMGLAGGGSTSEDTNGSLAGRVAYDDGKPAAGASVIVRPRGYLKDTADADRATVEVDAVTDSRGRYQVDSLQPGGYVVEIRDGLGRAALASGDVLPALGLDLGPDTLRKTGVLEGRLLADSGTGAGYVQIYGLERLARADSTGGFLFTDLPPGAYRLRPVSPVRGRAYPEPDPVDVTPGDTARVGGLPVASFEEEDYSLWPHTRNFFLNTAAAGILDSVVDYPLLVRLDAGNFDFAATAGRDIRFSDEEGRHLPYEIERWDADGRKAEIWVKVPVVRGNGRAQYITLYWGNPGSPDFSSGRSVFGAYAGVWHMGRLASAAGTEEYPDAAPSPAAGRAAGALGDTEGAVGRAAEFKGGQIVQVAGKPAFRSRSQVALSGWIRASKVDVEGGEVVSFGNNYGLRLESSGRPYFYLFNDSLYQGGTVAYDRWKICWASGLDLRDNAWHHLAAVWDGTSMRLYVDGRERARTSTSNPIFYAFQEDLWIGRLGADQAKDFHGLLDEVRTAGEAWPESKVKLDYESQKPGSTFLESR